MTDTRYRDEIQALADEINRRDTTATIGAPLVHTATVTEVDTNGELTIEVDGIGRLTGIRAISQHVQEVGRQLVVAMNGSEPVIITADLIAAQTILADMIRAGTITADRLNALFELNVGQMIQSVGFPGFGEGGPGWGIDASGRAEFNEAFVRGQLEAGLGSNLLDNGDFDVDVTGITAGSGAVSLETTPAEIDTGTGAAKHVTPASGSEVYLEFDPVAVTEDTTLTFSGRVKPGASGDSCRLGLRWYDASGTFISETFSNPVTGVTAYTDIELKASAAPSSVTGTDTYHPNSDVSSAALLRDTGTGTDTSLLYTALNEVGLDTSDVVYSTTEGFEHAGEVVMSFNVPAATYTGKTIRQLRFRTWVLRAFVAGGGSQSFQSSIVSGGTTYRGYNGDWYPPNDTTWHQATESFDINPETGVAWTPTEIHNFASGGGNALGIIMYYDVYSYQWSLQCAQIDMQIDWSVGQVPTTCRARLYTDPVSAGGTTTRWDRFTLREPSKFVGGNIEAETVEVLGRNVEAPVSATVATSQTRANTAYGDLATVGPSVTVVTRTEALVTLSCTCSQATADGAPFMGFVVTGATTLAADDARACVSQSADTSSDQSISRTFKVTGLTAGSNTFTAKYRNVVGTVAYSNRDITVTPL